MSRSCCWLGGSRQAKSIILGVLQGLEVVRYYVGVRKGILE